MRRQCWIVPTLNGLWLEVWLGNNPGLSDAYYAISREEWENQGGE